MPPQSATRNMVSVERFLDNKLNKNWETCVSVHLFGKNCKEAIKNAKYMIHYGFI